jgi:hypothetical protein
MRRRCRRHREGKLIALNEYVNDDGTEVTVVQVSRFHASACVEFDAGRRLVVGGVGVGGWWVDEFECAESG